MQLKWFSIEKIKNSEETVYPIVLRELLEDVLAGKNQLTPIQIEM